MTRPDNPYVIIGGGVSGMTAALILSKFGYPVTLVEKRQRLGATLRGFSRQGTNFDTGLHYVGALQPDGALTRYFRYLGMPDLPFADYNAGGFDRIRFIEAGREIRLPLGKDATIDYLSDIFPEDKGFVAAFYNEIEELYNSSTFLNFNGDVRDAVNAECRQESLAARLNRGTRNPILRAVLSIYSLLYGVSPQETPYIQHARVAGSYFDGVKSIAGGGKVLAAAFEKLLDKAGVTCLRDSEAVSIAFDNAGRAAGLVLREERYIPARGLLFTAHPGLLPAMLPAGAVKPAFSHRLASLEDTISSHTLFCSCQSVIPIVQGSNLYVCLGNDIERAFLPGCSPADGPFYISRGISGKLGAPVYQEGLMFSAPGSYNQYARWHGSRTGQRPPAYEDFKAERLEAVRGVLLRHCPELKDTQALDGGTPLTNRDYLGSPGGGLYGTKHSLKQFSPLPATRVPNLWMAGQSVIAPGVLGAVISAFVACGCILGMDRLQKELQCL
ncbi:MAG: FAD-dependent oxidoreductase [Desulfovibrio sp.]|jgi:all-trans-retinol 13,14-reductase|nr:FAD-dependent oxidoreductase [Desulfovibrio sp.]